MAGSRRREVLLMGYSKAAEATDPNRTKQSSAVIINVIINIIIIIIIIDYGDLEGAQRFLGPVYCHLDIFKKGWGSMNDLHRYSIEPILRKCSSCFG